MKRVITIIIVLAVIAGGAVAVKNLKAAQAPEKATFKVTKAEVGTVKKTVSATGVIKPWSAVDIKSKAGGRVDQLLVDVGYKVKTGQKLAMIDPTDTRLQVDQASADINSADARITQAEVTLSLQKQQSQLGVETARSGLAAAEANLQSAQARRETAKRQMEAQPELTKANVDSAKANLDNLDKQLAEMREATLPQERASAKSALDQAKANMANAAANLSRQKSLMEKGFVSQQVVDSALASFEVSRAQVDSASRKMETLGREQAASEAALVARRAQANAQYKNALAARVDIEIRKSAYAESEAAVKQSEQQVQTSRENLKLAQANLKNVQIREADIMVNRASRKRAEASLTNANSTMQQTVVTAPCDGVILQKYVEQGTIISSALSFAATGNNILQIGDVTRMYVDVTVDETDIANVNMGQNVDITIEAFQTASIEGKVTRIDPQALVEQNVTNVHVRVELDATAPIFRLLKPGMNATCEFVKKKKENVLSIPSEALRSDDKGSFVMIAEGGKPAPADPKSTQPPDPNTLIDVKEVRRPVKIALEGNDSVEIESGLKEGDLIVTQKIEPVQQQAGGALGSSRMGGFGGGRR